MKRSKQENFWRVPHTNHFRKDELLSNVLNKKGGLSSDYVTQFFGRRNFVPYRWYILRSSPVLVIVLWDFGPGF